MQWTHEHVEWIAAAVFTLVTALHLVRAVLGWSLIIGPANIPVWTSWIAVLVGGYLATHFWREILSR